MFGFPGDCSEIFFFILVCLPCSSSLIFQYLHTFLVRFIAARLLNLFFGGEPLEFVIQISKGLNCFEHLLRLLRSVTFAVSVQNFIACSQQNTSCLCHNYMQSFVNTVPIKRFVNCVCFTFPLFVPVELG